MKNRLIVLSILIVAISVVAYGVVKKNQASEIDALAVPVVSFTANEILRNTKQLYIVKGVYLRPVTRAKLQKSKLLSDFIEGYPVNWISAYISVEISNEENGVVTSLLSKSDVLSDVQINMLATSDIGAKIVVKVKYNTKNMITYELEESEMNVSLTVIPEVEAEYKGGYENLISYLRENSAEKMAVMSKKKAQLLTIRFLIDETGSTDNVKLVKTSGNAEIDNLLIELIVNMPKWIPAKNLKGENVSQQFDFKIGTTDGC